MDGTNIPDGIYAVMGAGGRLAMPTEQMGPGNIALLPPASPGDKTQQWDVRSGADSCTLRNVATGAYLGSDRDLDGPIMMLSGSDKPVPWVFIDGPDGDPDSYLLLAAASGGNLVLAPSLLRIYPPPLAVLPRQASYPFAWTFAKVG